MAPRPAASPQAAGRGFGLPCAGRHAAPPARPVEWAPCRRSATSARSAASSASGPPARTSPSSPTTASTRCSTAARRRPASRSATAAALVVYKDLGLVAQVFDEPTLDSLRGHIAIGHTRYSTTGSSTWENAQPTLPHHARPGRGIALGHNGNLVNTAELAAQAAELGVADVRRRDHRLRPDHRPARRRTRTCRSRRPRSRCCRPCAARSRWCSWTSTRSTRPATRTASARWCSAGWTAAGWSPARPRRWTSSAPRSSARSSRAS